MSVDRTAQLVAAVVALVATIGAAPVAAEVSLIDEESLSLGLGAYLGSFTGYQHTPYETFGLIPEESGTSAAVLRLEWRAGIGDWLTIDLQNRFFWSMSTTGAAGFGGVGLGSTVPPTRTVDLTSEILAPNPRLEHDLDRLALTFYTPVADIIVGRQAVTWGNSSLFTPADLWTQFSPFEIDTSQKRGVDAIRVLAYPGDLELEAIVVDRKYVEDLSGGVRLGWVKGAGDHYAALAKNYGTVWTIIGMAADLGVVRGHGELALPLELPLDSDTHLGFAEPRATIGADWFATSKLTLLAEYHLNGPGTTDASDYLPQLQSEEFARGERYFVGKHYGGLVASYRLLDDTLIPSLAVLSNLVDPSFLFSPSLAYQLSQNVSATFGAYVGLGQYPEVQIDPTDPRLSALRVNSEYGLYGQVFYLQISGYL